MSYGSNGSCAILLDGSAACWGSNRQALGAGDVPSLPSIGRVTPKIDGAILSFARGRNHSCTLLVDTTVDCWGGSYGLGRGQILYSGGIEPRPVLLEGVISDLYASVISDPGDWTNRTLSVDDDIVVFASVVGVFPTGTVDFFDDASRKVCAASAVYKRNDKYEYGIGATPYLARCNVPRSNLGTGIHTWSVRYKGDANHAPSQSVLATVELKAQPARLRSMVEFRNVPLAYYFMTSRQNEVDLLDAAKASGWERTGVTFRVVTEASVAANPAFKPNALSRFYFDKVALSQSRGGHFYTMLDADKDTLHSQNPGNLRLAGKPYDEGVDSFVLSAFSGSSSCAYFGLLSVFRMFRTKADDPNHRYVLDPAVVDSMNTNGWNFESTAFCAVP